MKKQARADIVLAVVIIGLAAGYLFANSLTPYPQIADPLGPRAFPTIIGIGLLVSGLLLLVEVRHRTEPADTTDAEPVGGHPHWRVLLFTLVWTIAYYGTMDRIGYLIGTVLYVFGLLAVFNRKHLVVNGVIAIAFSIIVDLIFSWGLGVSMPEGILAL